MKQMLFSTVAGVAMAMSAAQSDAAEVTITANFAAFNGPRAYAVVYLTDPNGVVQDTFRVAGRKNKYYRHLRDWSRGASRSQTPVHAVTGASVGSGRVLQVTATIADNLIAAGYQVRVDASVEDVGDYPSAGVLTLGQTSSVNGRGIIRTLTVN